jgi:hypothetical protein
MFNGLGEDGGPGATGFDASPPGPAPGPAGAGGQGPGARCSTWGDDAPGAGGAGADGAAGAAGDTGHVV